MNQPKKPTLSQQIGIVFSAFLGVQSDKNRQRDFAAGDPKTYIVIAIIATILLVLGLMTIVMLVLP